METVLTILLDSKWINSIEAGQAQRQYRTVTTNEESQKMLVEQQSDRLDHLWMKVLRIHPERDLKSLTKLIQLVMTLSHGGYQNIFVYHH